MNIDSLIDPTLPLVDLHRHLDGSMWLQTVLDLAQEHGINLPADDVEGLRPYVQVTGAEAGLMAFIAKFHYLTEVLADCAACYRVARENVEDALAEGIDYIELRFSPWFMAERHGLDPAGVVEAVVAGARAGEQATGVRANLIGILSRTYGPEVCRRELDAILAHRNALVAVDLAGDEAGFPAELFTEHFTKVRDADLRVTVHAGEADGPGSIWSAIRDLRAERIGHGFRAIEDRELVDYLAVNEIGLEISLTSNVHIGAVEDYRQHPIRKLLEHGVMANLNTDDPGISGVDLRHEYNVAAPGAGLSVEMIRRMQEFGLQMAFLDQAGKQQLIRKRIKSAGFGRVNRP